MTESEACCAAFGIGFAAAGLLSLVVSYAVLVVMRWGYDR